MYTVVKQAITRLTVASALLVTLISSVARAHQTCGQDDLIKCAQPLQVLTETGLSFVASKKDLEVICPDLHAGMRCVHSYTRRCMSLKQRSHFNKLFHGTSNMVKELCENGTFQEEFLKFAPCMREVVPQNEICSRHYQKSLENIASPPSDIQDPSVPVNKTVLEAEARDSIRNVCCSFQEYVECSTQKTRTVCGNEAARFSRGFLDKMASSMIKIHCSEYMHGSAKCPNSFSDAGITSPPTSLLAVLSLTLFSVFISNLR